MTPPVLVACVGNIFKRDDGFGVEVAARLARRPLPDGVRVVDFGIRSVHLVYELLDGYDVLVLVDTVAQQDGPPGIAVRDRARPAAARPERRGLPEVVLDPHDLLPGRRDVAGPDARRARRPDPGRGLPAGDLEDGIGLSDAVAAARGARAPTWCVDVVGPRAGPAARAARSGRRC